MELALLVLVILSGFIFLALFINRKLVELAAKNRPSDDILNLVSVISEASKEDRKILLGSLQENSRALNDRLDSAARIISDVQKNVGEMSEIGRSMRELQEFLQNPKIRGNVGEHVLRELLAQMLPKSAFHLQYSFNSGEVVDAAIKTTGGIIPIDSKFPMVNFRKMSTEREGDVAKKAKRDFQKDVKKHIDNISRKYILTSEGTVDYALMYVPSEAVYYEVVNSHVLFEYAASRRVLPVSPTTFYAYMKAILMSLEGQKVEKQALEILATLRALKQDYSRVGENLATLGRHINNAGSMMSIVNKEFRKIGDKLEVSNKKLPKLRN